MTYEITIDEETCAAIESQYVEGRSVSQIARMKLFQDIVRGVLVHRGVAMRSVGHNLRGRAPRVLQGAELVMAKTMREAGPTATAASGAPTSWGCSSSDSSWGA